MVRGVLFIAFLDHRVTMTHIPNAKQYVENVYYLLANSTNYVCPWECCGVTITPLPPTTICQHMCDSE